MIIHSINPNKEYIDNTENCKRKGIKMVFLEPNTCNQVWQNYPNCNETCYLG